MKKKVSLLILLAIFLIPSSTLFLASNDNVGFDFDVLPNQANNYTSLRYRSTTNIYNLWKVNLTDSWECAEKNDGCVTTFWLEHSNGENVSPSVGMAENDRTRYTDAYSKASKSDVRLTAENNNYNNIKYRIKGYWDEETD